MTTPLGDPVVLAAALALPALAIRSIRRRRTDNQLQATLRQARGLQDKDKRRQVFFDVARRYARNSGSRVDLKDTLGPGRTLDATRLGAPTPVCGVAALGPHDIRYSIQRSMLGNWKIWVAVHAEYDLPAAGGPMEPKPTRAGGDGEELSPAVRAAREPLTWAVVFLMEHKLAEFCSWSSNAQVPEDVDLELLFWDTAISLEYDTRKAITRTKWVGKIGEKPPSRFEWTIIPIPFFFDI